MRAEGEKFEARDVEGRSIAATRADNGPPTRSPGGREAHPPSQWKCRCGQAIRWAMLNDMWSWSFCPLRRWWNFWLHTAPTYTPEDL